MNKIRQEKKPKKKLREEQKAKKKFDKIFRIIEDKIDVLQTKNGNQLNGVTHSGNNRTFIW